MSNNIVIRTVDGTRDTWDSSKYGFTASENGYLMIQLAGPVTDSSVAIYAPGQWISVIDGGRV